MASAFRPESVTFCLVSRTEICLDSNSNHSCLLDRSTENNPSNSLNAALNLAGEWAGSVVNFFNFIWLHIGVADIAECRFAFDYYVELGLADFVH